MAMLTGAPPSISGVVGNDWYDRALKGNVTSVEDPGTRLLGGRDATGSSPHRLRVSTVGDELKMAHPASRVIGISHKDRSAILMAGRMADLALWWDQPTGAFVSSTWYAPELPKWAADFNAKKPADAWLGREWRALGEGGALLGKMPDTPGPEYYGRLSNSAFGNELLTSLAEAALEGEKLGTRDATDILALSYSCNDAVGHDKGPRSAEVRDVTVRTDLALDRLLAAIDRRVGLARTVVIVTADHGVAPVPEQMAGWKMPARVPPDRWSRSVLLSFDRERSGDVEVLFEPYWMASASGTTHGTAYSYDTHIPLIVTGPGIRPGRFDQDGRAERPRPYPRHAARHRDPERLVRRDARRHPGARRPSPPRGAHRRPRETPVTPGPVDPGSVRRGPAPPAAGRAGPGRNRQGVGRGEVHRGRSLKL